MLYENLDYLIEIIGLLVCIHCWYEKKFRLSFGAIVVICLDVLVCELINEYKLPDWITAIVYAALILYCFYQFDVSVKEHIVNMIMALISMSLFQLLAFLPTVFIYIRAKVNFAGSLFYNLVALALLAIFGKKIGFSKIKKYIVQHNWFTNVLVVVYSCALVYWLIQYRIKSGISEKGYIWLVLFCSIMCAAWYGWMKEKDRSREKELDLKIYELYSGSFEELLQQLRERQHDFKNHMQAIYNVHLLCSNYEELVEMQRKYCDELLWDNKLSGLLSCGNAILAGFLFGKFTEAERQRIEVEYEIAVNKETFSVPCHVIVETIGILWDNAVDAIAEREDKRIEIKIIEEAGSELKIEVTNEIGAMTMAEFMEFFKEGKSTKGSGHGIGLAKLRKYSRMYDWKIVVDIFEKLENRYLQISILLK